MSRSTKIVKGCSTQAANFYVSKLCLETRDMTIKELCSFNDHGAGDRSVASLIVGDDTPALTLKAARERVLTQYYLPGLGLIPEVLAAVTLRRTLRTTDVEIVARNGDIRIGKKGVLEVKSGYIGEGKIQANLNVRREQLEQGIDNFLFVVTQDHGSQIEKLYFLVPAEQVALLMSGSKSFDNGRVNLAYRPYSNGAVESFLNQYRLENSAELMKAFRKLR